MLVCASLDGGHSALTGFGELRASEGDATLHSGRRSLRLSCVVQNGLNVSLYLALGDIEEFRQHHDGEGKLWLNTVDPVETLSPDQPKDGLAVCGVPGHVSSALLVAP
jgi:hypothetical protein